MSRTISISVTAAMLLLLSTSGSRAQDFCSPDTAEISATQLLRALSLDLRGVVPTVEEYGAIVSGGEVDETLIDGWLASDEFAARAVRQHANLLWPSIANVRLVHGRARLTLDATTRLYYRRGAAIQYRGLSAAMCL